MPLNLSKLHTGTMTFKSELKKHVPVLPLKE